MRHNKIYKITIFSFLFLILSNPLFPQQKKTTVSRKFFEVDQSIEELRKEMAKLRKEIREIEIRTSIPEIRKEINKLIQIPELTHEIIMNNGTVVRGKVVHEDIDRVIIQTQIGHLTIFKRDIKLTRPAELPKAKCIEDGAVLEEIRENKRTYKGKIINKGVRRADFTRIIFYLFDETANLVAVDSTIVVGTFHMYKCGVQTDATIEPGQSFPFECTVEYPQESVISYYTKKIVWEEFE